MRSKEEWTKLAKNADEITEEILLVISHGRYGTNVMQFYPFVFQSVFEQMLKKK